MELVCEYCVKKRRKGKPYSNVYGLRRHITKAHPGVLNSSTSTSSDSIGLRNKSFLCQEPECGFSGSQRQSLLNHLREEHHLTQYKSFQLSLPDAETLTQWRSQLAEKTGSMFRAREGVYMVGEGKTCRVYSCIRSPCARSETHKQKTDTQRHSHMRATNNALLPFRCTAHLRATNHPNGSITLTGCLAHYGHDPKTDRSELSSAENGNISPVSDLFAEIYPSSIFPILTRPALAENDVSDTLIPLFDSRVPDDVVSWRYISTPLSSERKSIFSAKLDELRMMLDQLEAENSERALHHVTMTQQLLRSVGRVVEQPNSVNESFFNESEF